MKSRTLIRVAVKSIFKNKMRTLLTMLGIIIGVGAVIVMVAIGLGAQSQIQQQIQNLGTNMLVVTPGSSSSGGVSRGAGSFNRLTLDDAEGNDQDDVGFAPYTTVKNRLSGRSFIAQILASTSFPEDIPEAQEELALIMRESHELAAWAEEISRQTAFHPPNPLHNSLKGSK